MLRLMATRTHRLHLISDSTGETLTAIARASLARFPDIEPEIHVAVFVRSDADLALAIADLRRAPGLVCFTLVDPDHRSRLLSVAAELGLPAVPVLDPVTAAMAAEFGATPAPGVGLQHTVGEEYFRRIAAIDFAIANDDGMIESRFRQADVILVGVSRTSKTPTSIYLAHRGVRAANLPLVPGRDPPAAFMEALESGVPAIGLTASPARLSQIRSERLEALGDRPTAYAAIDAIRAEVAEARLFFERHRLPVIDITRRSIEETAAAVLAIIARRERKGGAC